MKKIIILLMVFSWALFADSTSPDARFEGWTSDEYVDTDLTIENDILISAPTGDVLSGSAGSLQTGDRICPTTIEATPTLEGRWADTELSVQSPFPACAAGLTYCPSMQSYSTLNLDRDITWLSDAVFNDQQGFGESTSFYTDDPDILDTLTGFQTQRVSYFISDPDDAETNRRGKVGVFCKADVVIRRGGTDLASFDANGIGFAEIELDEGTYNIRGRARNMECFAAVEKVPENANSNTEYFRVYYMVFEAPNIENLQETKTLTVQDVQYSANDISTVPASSTASPICGQPGEELEVFIRTTYENTGDANDATVEATDVEASGAFDADPRCAGFIRAISCAVAGISDGYDSNVDPDEQKDLLTRVTVPEGIAPGVHTVTLTFTYRPTESVCTGVDERTFSTNIFVNTTAGCGEELPAPEVGCFIEPDDVVVPAEVNQDFQVTCFEGSSDVACSGLTWAASGSLGATFVSSGEGDAIIRFGNENATGQVVASRTGYHCNSTVTVLPPLVVPGPGNLTNVTNATSGASGCVVSPPSATLERNELGSFDVLCITNSTALPTCSSGMANAQWDAEGVLGADFTLDSGDSAVVRFTNENVTGLLRAETPQGYLCNSSITVVPMGAGNETGNLTDTFCPDGTLPPCPGDEDFEQICTLDRTTAIMSPEQQEQFTLGCSAEVGGVAGACTSVDWEVPSILTEVDRTDRRITVEAGIILGSGYVIATSEQGMCRVLVSVEEFSCRELV